ncbi:protein piccolo-like [Manacus candei]|uniref:protein piccolo-like n=1 Tax=Manacus candei TaxID=415023 RepID=UPI002225BC84|nr:protein piccolo-like [Manacus candei]
MRSRKRDAGDHVVSEGGRARGSDDACAVALVPLQRSPLDLRAGSGGTAGAAVSRLSRGVRGGNNVKIFGGKRRNWRGSFSGWRRHDRKSFKALYKDGGPGPEVRPEATLKTAPPGPELSPGHTQDGGERPPRLREAFILLPDLRPDPDPRPAPTAPSRRAASRCGDGAGRSAAPGAGGRFAGGGRHRRGQPPLGAAAQAQARDPRQSPPARPAPLRPAPLRSGLGRSRRAPEMLSGLRRRLPPPEATHGGRSDVGLCRRSSPGLPLSLRSPWVCRTPLAGLTLWLLCPACCAVCACSILSKTKLPFLVGMDRLGFGNLAPRKTV